MAEWIPSIKIAGGLYGGTSTPQGNLESFIERCNTPVVTGAAITAAGSHYAYPGREDPFVKWPGAFGSNDTRMYTYAEAHKGEGQVTFPWAIFEIENPDGAQFYKQELVVEAKVTSYIDSVGQWGSLYVEIGYSSIYRREYATPTSIPEVTNVFWSGFSGDNANYTIIGPEPADRRITKSMKFPVSYLEYNERNYLCFAMFHPMEQAQYIGGPGEFANYRLVGISTYELARAFGDNFGLDEEDDPYIDPDPPEPGDDPSPAPGDREKDYDPVPIPPVPGLTALGAGFLSLYSPSATLLNLFADELYSDNVLQIIHNYFSNVADMIAGLAIVPFFVPISGFYKHRVGLFTTDIAFPKVSSQFIDVDCGSIDVKHFYNAFLDYAPNTKIMIWLPYIGYQELNADEVMNTVISVKYRCDILSGACVAFVSITGGAVEGVTRVIAQFSGNVLTQVPAAAASYDSMVSSAINILTASVGIAAGAAIGGAGAGAAGAAAAAAPSNIGAAVGAQVGLGMAGTAGNAIMSMKPNVVRNGTPGSTTGYMGVQKPYLIKIVPRSAVAPNHIQLKGYPSNYGGTLAGLSGYCEVSEIQLANCPAEVDEKTEIYSLLKGGVIV